MKKIFILGLCLLSSALWAQEATPEAVEQDPKVQERIRSLRIAYISDKLQLSPAQAEKFWPVYQEYSDKRRAIQQEFRETRKDIKTDNPDQAQQEEMVRMGLALKQRELDLEKDYSGRLLKIISAQQILNLRRAEGDFQQMIIKQLQQRRVMQQRNENLRERNQRERQRN